MARVLKFLVDRLVLMVFVLFGASLLIFLLIHLVPGDPVRGALGIMVSDELIVEMRQRLGLDEPLHVQYLSWLGGVFRGDFGTSFQTLDPVAARLGIAFPVSLELVSLAVALSLLVAIPLGILVTIYRRFYFSFIFSSLVCLSMPQFWVAILLIMWVANALNLVDVSGFVFLWEDPVRHLQGMLLPVLTLALPMVAVTMRITRTSMLEVLQKDYIRTMKSLGLGERRVIFTHVLNNAIIPIVTITGLQFGYLLGGAVIIEQIFGLPGLGKLILQSASAKDYPTIQAVTLVITLWFVFINFATDVLYAYLDPRIKYD